MSELKHFTPRVHINQFAIKGETGTGYEHRDGPKAACSQKDMVAKSKQPMIEDHRSVTERSCCAYLDRDDKSGPFECGNCEYLVNIDAIKRSA